MNLAPIDLALLGGVVLVVGIGLFRGLSGELASFLGFVAAVAVGYCRYGFVHAGARAVGFNKGDATELVATGVAVFLLSIVAFGLTWRIVNKFISFLVPQPTNALLGALSGAVKSLVLLLLLAGVGFMPPGTYAQSGLSRHSQVIRELAGWADAFGGAHQERGLGADE